jgi:hypothetical protein
MLKPLTIALLLLITVAPAKRTRRNKPLDMRPSIKTEIKSKRVYPIPYPLYDYKTLC